ncbi:unnamed protein product [Trichobilharzia szidati]|nr:unnamed protein product [Trichobilharzia szidati]
MEIFKNSIQNAKIRFEIVALVAAVIVILSIWHIKGFTLNDIGQYISMYENSSLWDFNETFIYYPDFQTFKTDVISGRVQLNKTKMHNIVIYGEMLASINKDVRNCAVNNCLIHTNSILWTNASLILIPNRVFPRGKRPEHQAWVAYDYESPIHSRLSYDLNDKINFTATYRFDSTIRTPYGMYTPNPSANKDKGNNTKLSRLENVAAGKDKAVAWIVSNCHPHSPRKSYADELAKYITVDVYGGCGRFSCGSTNCFIMLRKHYKFYLSFENSLCKDYITEKFFSNALMNNVLPIVMGASIEEYQKVAPPHSFIHVDEFDSPKELAEYLKYLDKNDTAYNEYFAWHDKGVVSMWSSKPECEFCLLANAIEYLRPTSQANFSVWWRNGCNGRKLRWK